MPLADYYDIILFESPGQGCVLEDQKIPITTEWQKPVGAVLDYFSLDDVTLMGISMGGMLVLRAAAYEKRAKRIIAYDVMFDVFTWKKQLPMYVRVFLDRCMDLKLRWIINRLFYSVMNKRMDFEWGLTQAMRFSGVSDPYEIMAYERRLNPKMISQMVNQDVLILAGRDDFAIADDNFILQMDALKNTRSLTGRQFSKAEYAQDHCQIGNIGLLLDMITDWINLSKRHSDDRPLPSPYLIEQ